MTHAASGARASRDRAPLGPARTNLPGVAARRASPWALALMLALAVPSTSGQPGPPAPAELVVCAEEANLPFSNERMEGVENRLAALLADELGLAVSYRWLDLSSSLRRYVLLERGDCDLVMAVAEGQEGYLTTIAYYTSPYAFVYSEGSGVEIASLDDPALRELRIGVQVPAGGSAGPAWEALAVRGLVENAVRYAPEPGEDTPLGGVVAAVAAGEVDLGIAWGPVAGYFAARSHVPLVVRPVEPAIDPPFQPLSFAIAMGARPGDDALVESLNLALAARWDEVQALLAEADFPVLAQPRPRTTIASPGADEPLRVGVVAPQPTPGSRVNGTYYTDLMGEAVRLGALLAEGEAPGVGDRPLLKVRLASAPNPDAAVRAARRLVAEGAKALVGGVGAGQAEALSAVAAEAGVLFFDVGAVPLQAACSPVTFHLGGSPEAYLTALYDWFGDEGERWFLVHEESEEGTALAGLAEALAASRPGGSPTFVGRVGVEPRALNHLAVLETVAAADPDVVLLTLQPEDQVDFLSQQEVMGPAVAVAPYPHLEAQSRERLANMTVRSANRSLRYRVQVWEPTLGVDDEDPRGGDELNARFAARYGRPMDPPAWAAYQAVTLVAAAAERLGTFTVSSAIELLEGDLAALGMDKPAGGSEPARLAFSAGRHELIQPLYVIEVDPEAEWGRRVSDQLAIARPVAAADPAPLSAPSRPCGASPTQR